MELIAEIFRNKRLFKKGEVLQRDAVRGVVFNEEGKLLMVFSPERRDYKLPGGGVKTGESHLQALKREIREECGLSVDKIKKEIGLIIEYKEARDPGYDIFQMNSHYYLCTVKKGKKKQGLDEYEKELGFMPIWISIEDAFFANKKILESKMEVSNSWVERETKFLEWLKKEEFPIG